MVSKPDHYRRRIEVHRVSGAGPHAVKLARNSRLASGIYFVKLQQGNERRSR
jgi:hypothetical protein